MIWLDTYPGYSPLVALMMTRLALGTRNTEMAQKMAHEAKRLATMYQNPRAAERAGELEQEARA